MVNVDDVTKLAADLFYKGTSTSPLTTSGSLNGDPIRRPFTYIDSSQYEELSRNNYLLGRAFQAAKELKEEGKLVVQTIDDFIQVVEMTTKFL